MLHWAAMGMFFKAVCWAIGFILLAKGASKLFFWNELIGNIYMLGLNLLGYHFMGLTGLGLSFMAGFLLYVIQIYFVAKIKYSFSFDSTFIRIFIFQFLLSISCLIVVKILKGPFYYLVGIGLIMISTWLSYAELDKRIGIMAIIVNYRDKYLKR
jgi:O-antigen/teichoic acid export membrane protein